MKRIVILLSLSIFIALAINLSAFADSSKEKVDFFDNIQVTVDDEEVDVVSDGSVGVADFKICHLSKTIKKDSVVKLASAIDPELPVMWELWNYNGDQDNPFSDQLDGGISLEGTALPLTDVGLIMQVMKEGVEDEGELTIILLWDYEVDGAEMVINVIDSLPTIDDLSIGDKEVVLTARAAYNSLPEDDKANVTNYDKLVAAEAKIADLEKAAEFDEAVGTLPDLDNLTETDYEKIAAIKEKYDALTADQKKLVSNEAALRLAFEKLAVKKLQDELNETKDALNEALENETPESDINKLVEDVKQTKENLKDATKKLSVAEATLKVKSTVIKKVKAKAQKKKTTVTWKSAGSEYKYEVYKSLKVSGGYKKTATSSKTKVIIKKLKSKKTYYVKVRGFKTVNGKKIYTQYSDVVSVKIK